MKAPVNASPTSSLFFYSQARTAEQALTASRLNTSRSIMLIVLSAIQPDHHQRDYTNASQSESENIKTLIRHPAKENTRCRATELLSRYLRKLDVNQTRNVIIKYLYNVFQKLSSLSSGKKKNSNRSETYKLSKIFFTMFLP